MIITFTKLQTHHLMLLLKWLETPHVKAWWDRDVVWTPKLIKEKYGTYIENYKIEDGIRKPMHAYIIIVDGIEIGYIQYYNAYDFAHDWSLEVLPTKLAFCDIFIGEYTYVNKGIGSEILKEFCMKYIFKEFMHCLIDPEVHNLAAIRACSKAGFKELYRTNRAVIMLKSRNNI